MNISSVVPSSDTATDTMTDFEKVDRVRRSSADTCLIWLPSGAYTRSFWIGIFHIGNLCFWVPFLKQLLLRNCAVDFVEICNVYVEKMIIKAVKRIFNSDKICRSYSDLNFGVTFLEHSVYCSVTEAHQCQGYYAVPRVSEQFLNDTSAHTRLFSAGEWCEWCDKIWVKM